MEAIAAAIRKPADMIEAAFALNRPEELPEGDLAFTTDDEIDLWKRGPAIGIHREAWIVSRRRRFSPSGSNEQISSTILPAVRR